MTALLSRPAWHSASLGRLWRLAARRMWDRLEDDARAPVLGVSEQIVPDVLRTLAIPGYAAPAHPLGCRLPDRSRRPETHRLWVGASAQRRAEQVLVAVMPCLARVAARCASSASR